MKRSALSVLLALSLLAAGTAGAQHSRQALLNPGYKEYNLRWWPRQMTVTQQYEDGNDVNFQETYIFDSTGHLAQYGKRGFGGETVTDYPLAVEDLQQDRHYDFDYDGDVLQLVQYDRKGCLYSTTHCIYAEGGNLVMTVEYTYSADSGMVTKRTVSRYDKHERLASVEQYSADELLLWREKRSYDRRGNLTKRSQTFYNDDGSKEVTTEKRSYTFDARGNWTICRYSLNGMPMYTIRRAFIYYGE